MPQAFPKGFLWGAATAAHQVEGGNVASDLWAMEMAPESPFPEPSADACDHYHLYPKDIADLKSLGFNAYRFSLEWARIEPEEGFFSNSALNHYRRMIAECLAHDVTPMVTFHHFTAPLWFSKDGGWGDANSVDRFARYCEKAGRALGDLIPYACTINEANVPMLLTLARQLATNTGGGWHLPTSSAAMAEHLGCEPERFAPYLMCDGHAASPNLLAAHRKGYATLKSAGVKGKIGITLALQDLQAAPGSEALRDMVDQLMNGQFLVALKGDDFVGVQTYTRIILDGDKPSMAPAGAEVTQMGYEFYPEALEATVRSAARATGCPVVVTENGIATEDDTRRIEYTRRALEGVQRCLKDGIDVQGYMHWSMLDNFEWFEGYRPKFGIIAVDRATQARRPKPSAYWLGEVARKNRL